MNNKLTPEIAAAFAEEAKSYFVQIQDAVFAWASGNTSALEQPRRLMHTIKGAAAMVGLPALAHTSLLFEETIKTAMSLPPFPGDRRAEYFSQALAALDRYTDGLVTADRRNSELESCVIHIRRLTNEPVSGDADAIRVILRHEDGAAMQSPAPAAAAPVSDDLISNFRQESEDLLQLIGRTLRLWQNNQNDQDVLRALRRGIHSLKGTSQSVGQRAAAELSHLIEDLLDSLIGGAVAQTAPLTRQIFEAFDTLSDLVTGEISESEGWDRVNQHREQFSSVQGEAAPEESTDNVPAEFLEVFRPEADEHLTAIATGLRDLEGGADKTVLQDVRRAVHTLKGAAGVIGLMSVNTLAHRMEDLLDAAWEGGLTLGPTHRQLLHSTADVLADLVGDSSKHAAALERRKELLAAYDALEGAKPTEGESIELQPQPAQEAARNAESVLHTSRYVRVPLDRLDEMVRLVSELVVSRSTFEQHLDAYRTDIGELRHSLSRLHRLSHRFDTDFEVQALMGGGGQGRAGAFDRRAEFDTLEFDRYTDLHLVARDLGETTSDINVGVSQLTHTAGDFDSYVNRMGRLTSDIQDRLMRMRMVPVANLATRLHRTVRVTADKLGKQVDLILEGEEIEMDKTALEELAGPLEHLLRNAIDHGIESEAARRAAGKPSRGRITVKAYYAGTQVVVDVTDDGHGIDVEAVRQRALAAGLASESDAARMSDEEIYDFIFEPGFSTAETVSEISGRGVGLDVVRSAAEKLKGVVKVSSDRGIGSSFHLRLPMSLAILRVLIVKSRGESYAVPLANVTRILRIDSSQLEKLGNQQVLRVGQQVLPAVRLEEALGARAKGDEEADAVNPKQPVLVVDIGGQQAAVLVDELLLAREVVVKTLGSMVRKVRGVTGATILGDGGIVLIINTADLFEGQRSGETATGARSVSISSRRSRGSRKAGHDILVVDDSVSVRRVLTNLFQNQGWRPVAARDGSEALEILQSGKTFDAVLLDMEMPRMDGFELLTILRGQAQFASLPVVMLTSRAADKHRRKAFELGATEFLVKPYQDEALVGVINRVVRGSEALAG